MLDSFLSFLQSQRWALKERHTLLAVSGGIDSVVLAALFKQAGFPFAIAHCDFNLRGEESTQDADFVQQLAAVYQVPFYRRQFQTTTFASTHKLSIQVAARKLRYDFFYELLASHGFSYIATAHHLDDSVETMLLNLIKGRSIDGLYGITAMNGPIIRPLLFAYKNEICNYATQQQLQWREDSSNKNIYYQRNLIRHQLIPLIHKLNPNFSATMQRSRASFKAIGLCFQTQVAQLRQKVYQCQDAMHIIAIDALLLLPWATVMAFELVRPYGFTFHQIQQLMEHPLRSGKTLYAPKYTLYTDRNRWLIIGKKDGNKAANNQPMIAATGSSAHYNGQRFRIKRCVKVSYTLPTVKAVAALDFHALNFPLMIRSWQTGDRFYPLGMQHAKKISDFLIDQKVPCALKEDVLVITSGDQIVWVVGYRIDERFKVNNQTKEIVEITCL